MNAIDDRYNIVNTINNIYYHRYHTCSRYAKVRNTVFLSSIVFYTMNIRNLVYLELKEQHK